MKSAKSLLAFVAIFGAATSAFADHSASATILRLTGSSAYRSPVMTQLFGLFTQNPGVEPLVAFDTGAGTLTSSNSAFIWGHIGGTEVILETTFNGSAAGVQAVANNGTLNISFLADTLADSGGAATYASSVSGGTSGQAATNSKHADVTMSDVFQSATSFRSPTLVDNTVAVVTFEWVTNPGQTATSLSVTTTAATASVTTADTSSLVVGMSVFSSNIPATTIASIDSGTTFSLTTFSGVKAATANATFVAAGANPLTNVTPQLAQAVYSAGSASLALFTGNHADETTNVFALGRNPDSGTRITAFAETGVGINSGVEQYQPTISTGTITTGAVTSQALWPQDTVNGLTFTLGNSGFNSGGGLRTPLEATTSAIGGYYLGYLGVSDALTVIGLGGHALTYNGVPFTTTGVEEGKYTFWSYEHLMYQSSLASAKKTLANTFVSAILAAATAGNGSSVKTTDMQVVRLVDGGVVTQNY